jgi:8-hydroxy-5-deazaflavin:NADPH oxidoreductase
MLRIFPTQGNVFSRSASTLTLMIASSLCSADSIWVSRKSSVANSLLDSFAAVQWQLRQPRAQVHSSCDAEGEIVVITIPLKEYRTVPVEPLAGKIVIDTNNYYPQRDGHIPQLDNESTITSELLQAHLPTSKVVKAFNHIYAAALTTDGQPAGTKNRRALVIAGDDQGAKASVARLLDQFGFDTVDAGQLREGWRIQRDTPGYRPRRTADELRRDLAAAKRYADR